MDIFSIALILSALLCSLVAGFVLAFAVVVMPGITGFKDSDYLQAFKAMDAVIQNNQPLFMIVWVGSILAIVITAFLGIPQLAGTEQMLLIVATVVYLFGVQLPTMTINVPLNNQLQKQDLDEMTAAELQQARQNFEPRWIRWNSIRTVFATLTSALLIFLIFRL